MLSEEELALVVEALEEAAFFRDARSRVLDSAARKRERLVSPDQGGHREKARVYLALASRLKKRRDADR